MNKQIKSAIKTGLIIGSSVAIYEGIAYGLNKTMGVGLPYTPAQITPGNVEGATAVLIGSAASSIVTSLLMRI